MNETVLIALIGVLGTLLAPLVAQLVELKKVGTQFQFEERQKQRELQRTWFMEHNEKRYGQVKQWVIESVKAINLYANLIELSEDIKRDPEQYQTQFQAYKELHRRLEVESVEIVAIAHSDPQLARKLDSFAYWLRRPEITAAWIDDASRVLVRISEIMSDLPGQEINNSIASEAEENKVRQAPMKRRMLWYACFIMVLVVVAGWWFFMYSR